MPQRVQPKSLADLSVKVSAQNILRACSSIESECGDYDRQECRTRIKSLQLYLLETIPAVLLDKLCERRTQSLEYDLIDHRLLLAVYFHPNMRGFSSSSMTLRAIFDETFWFQQIISLKNLVVLDLKLMCTDEILKIVGKNCPKLEVINCISKMSTMPRFPVNTDFNALKIALYVSDVGLQCLTECRKLKKITMNRKLNSQCAGKKPTMNGIRNLLKSLPEIQCLTFEDLGTVISSGMEDCVSLPLLQLSDTHPTPQHMQEIGRLCPKLKELMLVSTFNYSSKGILSALGETSVKLELLGLEFFPFDDDLTDFLSIKGEYLVCLQLLTGSFGEKITSQQLILIGEYCINLSGLHLHGLAAETNSFPKRDKRKDIFTKLTCISLAGENWNPYVILPICITPAHNLVRLSLSNRGSEIVLNDLFEQIMLLHSFEQFKMLYLLEGCPISLPILKKFIYHCPQISIVKIKPSLFRYSDMGDVIKEFSDLNYNLTIEVLDT